MSTPKAQTIQSRFGFKDADLTTPKHDEIMFWLDQHVELIVSELFGLSFQWGNREQELQQKMNDIIAMIQNDCQKAIEIINSNKTKQDRDKLAYIEKVSIWNTDEQNKLLDKVTKFLEQLNQYQYSSPLSDYPKSARTGKEWEHAITTNKGYNQSQNKYVIGFVDLQFWYNYYQIILKTPYRSNNSEWKLDLLNLRIPTFDIFLSGSSPEYAPSNIHFSSSHHSGFINFEVKTKIPSLGELFRQIRMYQEYTSDPFVIVSPDDRYQQQIEAQGLKFVKYLPNRYDNSD